MWADHNHEELHVPTRPRCECMNIRLSQSSRIQALWKVTLRNIIALKVEDNIKSFLRTNFGALIA